MPVDKDQQDTQARPFTPVRQVPPVSPVTFTPAGRHRGEDPADPAAVAADPKDDEDSTPDGDENPTTTDTVDDLPSAVDPPAAVPTQREDKSDWQRVQASFVDDPRASVDAAASMVKEAVGAIQNRERQLRSTWEGNGTDTETLRAAFRDYRTLYDQLTGL